MYTPQPLSHSSPSSKVETDPKIESSINAIIDETLAEEEKVFTPGLESFTVHASKIRQSMRAAFATLQTRLQNGYDAMASWLEAQGIAPPCVTQEVVDSMESEQFLERVSGSEALFQILGFSDADMANLYRAAYEITHTNDYEKGKEAFFFLVTIAPNVSTYWLGLAICTTCLNDNVAALDATLCAIDLDPLNIDSYHNAIYLYLQAHDTSGAEALCMQGIEYGLAHSDDAGAPELVSALKNAQNYINLHKDRGG